MGRFLRDSRPVAVGAVTRNQTYVDRKDSTKTNSLNALHTYTLHICTNKQTTALTGLYIRHPTNSIVIHRNCKNPTIQASHAPPVQRLGVRIYWWNCSTLRVFPLGRWYWQSLKVVDNRYARSQCRWLDHPDEPWSVIDSRPPAGSGRTLRMRTSVMSGRRVRDRGQRQRSGDNRRSATWTHRDIPSISRGLVIVNAWRVE